MKQFYPIGQAGTPWSENEKETWLAQTEIKRSYNDLVIIKIDALRDRFQVEQYGALSINSERYPLFGVRNKNWHEDKPVVLITGGVHGYEASGVQGALKFLDTQAEAYSTEFNFIVTPCISPWGYETINRWNPFTVDPNRSFHPDSPSEECAQVMAYVHNHSQNILAHIDLHETTDTDESEFRPALAARNGEDYIAGNIPDGFYLVGDISNPTAEFQTAVINEVRKITHIAPADEDGKLIGEKVVQEGVINVPVKKAHLCAGFTNAEFNTTTEVYPDSDNVTDEECNDAQVAAILGALEYLKNCR
ncbi:M14 family metallopeptidase [Veronia pacifica]|uniref:Peptidase n=1 Tax=Veronia pacifica TaxID=1080227 RepID=A0A1C3EQW7_9GAMM|nr:M14 family metallocarboxypeptidase [Veronia pacifica]ODA35638.1 peptidase [Veronia pacifica]